MKLAMYMLEVYLHCTLPGKGRATRQAAQHESY